MRTNCGDDGGEDEGEGVGRCMVGCDMMRWSGFGVCVEIVKRFDGETSRVRCDIDCYVGL